MTNFHLALEQVFLVWKLAIEAEEFLFFWVERLQGVSGSKSLEVEMSYTYVNFVLLMWIHLARTGWCNVVSRADVGHADSMLLFPNPLFDRFLPNFYVVSEV